MKKELLKNKIHGTLFMGLGFITLILSKDATFFLMTLIAGIGLFLARENYID